MLNGKMFQPILAATFVAASAFAATAADHGALSEDKFITDSLVAAGVGDVIRKECPNISARLFVVWGKTRELERYALGLGYTEKQIRAFIGDKSERARIRQNVVTYLMENGVKKGNKDSFCALGQAEIKNKTIAGSLLRSRQ